MRLIGVTPELDSLAAAANRRRCSGHLPADDRRLSLYVGERRSSAQRKVRWKRLPCLLFLCFGRCLEQTVGAASVHFHVSGFIAG